MDVLIKFLGGAKTVTGSKYLVEIDGRKILVDCGMFQGKKELRLRNWYKLPIDPGEIETVLITHAHIDHTGYLPRLVKDGFKGSIVCSEATEDLMKIMLIDAARLQEEEAEFAFRRGYSKHKQPEPLFSESDARRVLELVRAVPMDKPIPVMEDVDVTFRLAGHILGATSLEVTLHGKTQEKKMVFSGDLGRQEDPIMFPPSVFKEADILLVESTYGDRINPMENVVSDLTRIIHETIDNGGCLVVPAFAVGRTQNLIFYFLSLMEQKKIPTLPIYIDSPMAISVTDLYERHSHIHKITKVKGEPYLFDSPLLHFCNTVESSKALNDVRRGAIIISASGMCTGGRILHHLFNRLSRENDTVLFVGYQAEGTRGRDLLEGKKFIRMFGEDVPVKCRIAHVNGLSAHADQPELLAWLRHFQSSPKFTFITHGEYNVAMHLKELIESELKWKAMVPEYLESFELFNNI